MYVNYIEEPEEARKKTLRNILERCDREHGYIEITEYDGEPFVLIHDKNAVERAVSEIVPVEGAKAHGIHVILPAAGYDEYGFDDEYSHCDGCGAIGYDCPGTDRRIELFVSGCELWCEQCIEDCTKGYIEGELCNEYEAISYSAINEQTMNDNGYVKVREGVESHFIDDDIDDDAVLQVWTELHHIDKDAELVNVRAECDPCKTDVYIKASTISLGAMGELYDYLQCELEDALKVMVNEDEPKDVRAVYAGKVETLRHALQYARGLIEEVFE